MTIHDLHARIQSGTDPRDVARDAGISYGTLRRRLAMAGLPIPRLRPGPRSTDPTPTASTPTMEQRARRVIDWEAVARAMTC